MNALMRMLVTGLVLTAVSPPVWAGPEVPGAPQKRPIALVGGTVFPVVGKPIDKGTVLLVEGKIAAVGRDVAVPEGAERVDVSGKRVYPGLFDANTQLGLVEIPSVRGSVDTSEAGESNPNAVAQTAFYADSDLIPVTRANGVLLALVAPQGGLVSGLSSVMQLDGWNNEDMTLRRTAALHVVWPRSTKAHTWRLDDEGEESLAAQDKTIGELRRMLAEARAYWIAKTARAKRQSTPLEVDIRWEALIPLFERKLPLVVQADETQQIHAAVALAAQQGLKLLIYGGYDAPECVELLKKYDVGVIVAGVTRLPQRRHDPVDAAFSVPARLQAAGVRYCISGAGRMGNVRNLPYQAGMAAGHGLARDEALRTVTLYPAQMFGVAERVGSLEAGKDATLFVADGDILETPTHVTRAYVEGRAVDLSNRQTRLFDKYQERQKRLSEKQP